MKKLFCLLLIILLNFQAICFANLSEKDVQVSLTQVPLNSRLKKQYNAYRYTITNNSNQDVSLVNAQINNAVSGNIAYQAVDNGHPIGTTWAICGPLGLVTFGLGWVAGIVATPIVWLTSEKDLKKAQVESVSYPNIVNIGTIQKGEVVTTDFLVPIGTKPQIRLTVQPEKSKELVNINSL